MTDSDKNQHLSPILDDIKDFGPGESGPGESGPGEPESDELVLEEAAIADEPAPELAPPEEMLEDDEPTPEPAVEIPQLETAAKPKSGSSWPVILLSLLLLISLLAGGGAAWWQQGRIDVMQQQIQSLQNRPPPEPAPNPELTAELAQLQDLADELMAEGDALRAEIALAEQREAELAISLANAQSATEEAQAATQAAQAAIAETRTEPVSTTISGGGSWYVNLRSYKSEQDARSWANQLSDSPRQPQVVQIQSKGKTMYRVRLPGFANQTEAQQMADQLKQRWSLRSPWVTRN